MLPFPFSHPYRPSPLQSCGSLAAPILTVPCFCRRLELGGFNGFVDRLPSIKAPNIEKLGLIDKDQLTNTIIGQIAVMTSLKCLELQCVYEWDDVRPIAALPLLTRLTCDCGVRFMADLLQPGCLQSLEVASAAPWVLNL